MDNNTANISPEVIKQEIRKLESAPPKKSLVLDQLLKDVKIDLREPLAKPPTCWSILNDNGTTSIIGTLGNFSMVIGKAKSRKTFFICLAVSATVKNDVILNRFKGCLSSPADQVIYFDTEQGKYHVQQSVKRVCSMVNDSHPENLHVYGLRKYDPATRLKLIEHAIYSNDRVGFVVIDGIKDLISSINDEAEASMIASKLLKWTEERNIHIVTVLHQNKGDNNARGHIGSELMNKAETVLSVSKSPENKDISIVTAEYCRDKEPEPFAFEINEDGLPVLTKGWQVKTAKKMSEVGADELLPGELDGVIAQCFFSDEELTYGDLQKQMVFAVKKRLKRKIGTNKAGEFITYCKNEGLIIQEIKRGPYRRVNTE